MKGRRRALGAMLLVSSIAWIGAAQTQSVSYTDAMTMLTRDCGADIKKFCRGINLGGNQIGNCLERNRERVSPQCISTMAAVIASIDRRLSAQASVFKVCDRDVNQYCNGVVGEVHILQCLIKTERIDSAKCNQAITDAGWR